MISFIIPAHNEEKYLGPSLTALQGAAATIGEEFEILVVNDSSTDSTGEIARSHGVKVVEVLHRQIAATRNSGGKESKGEFLFFIDADTCANTEAIRAGMEEMRKGAAGGGCLFRFDSPIPWWLGLLLALFTRLARLLKLAGGCFIFCTREAFEKTGGFPEKYYASEELVFAGMIKKFGKFVIAKPTVVTSARKIHTVHKWDFIKLICRYVWKGSEGFTQREGLGVWYGPRQ